MSVALQIVLGSILLGACSLIHIALLVKAVDVLKGLGAKLDAREASRKMEILTIVAFGTVVLAHTVQVWLWALSFVLLGALPEFNKAIYFALVTYTTLGYGDVTLNEGLRVFGAMASVTGLLNFGLSTAFLVGFFTRRVNDVG